MSKEAMITLHATLDGFPLDIATHATVDQLPAMVQRLRAVGCTPPGQSATPASVPTRNGSRNGTQAPRYDVNGHPCCPYHDAPLIAGTYGYFCPEKHPAAGGPVDKKGYCGYRLKFEEVA